MEVCIKTVLLKRLIVFFKWIIVTPVLLWRAWLPISMLKIKFIVRKKPLMENDPFWTVSGRRASTVGRATAGWATWIVSRWWPVRPSPATSKTPSTSNPTVSTIRWRCAASRKPQVASSRLSTPSTRSDLIHLSLSNLSLLSVFQPFTSVRLDVYSIQDDLSYYFCSHFIWWILLFIFIDPFCLKFSRSSWKEVL